MFAYAYSPATGADIAARDAAFDAARDLDAENDVPPAVTLQQIHARSGERRARRAFGDIANASSARTGDSRSEMSRKRAAAGAAAGSARSRASSRATTAATDASTVRAGSHRAAPRDVFASTPRTPEVDIPPSPSELGTAATDDTVPPGALTIQRAADFRRAGRHHPSSSPSPPTSRAFPDLSVVRESAALRLALWRDPARSALAFGAGALALAAFRAPGLVAAHFPLNPVVLFAYAAMAYLARANLLCLAFPSRAHGLRWDPEEAARTAGALASVVNAVVDAQEHVLSGRSNAAVLRAFLGLYAVAQLGARLNSTWWALATLWCGAFAIPPALERKRREIAAGLALARRELLERRWYRLSSGRRWGVSVVLAAFAFWFASFGTRCALGFAAFVAGRLYRETHRERVAGLERAVRTAGKRVSRAGSELRAYVGNTPVASYLRRRTRRRQEEWR